MKVRWGRVLTAVVPSLAVFACGGDDAVSRVEVEVQYPSDSARDLTNSLHVWIVEAKDTERGTCGALIARTIGPYASAFEVLADEVFLLPDEPMPAVDGVPRGDVLVYLEGVDFVGEAHLAACAAVDVKSGTESVVLALTAAGTFDCADPAAADGAPCDDGVFCTVAEVCAGGACAGGIARDCNAVADSCNSGACDEQLGCVATPLPDGTPCIDPLFCTTGEVCTVGSCVGVARDCTGVEDQCNTSTCDETFDQCRQVPLSGAACEDGDSCTVGDLCDFGFCASGALLDEDMDGYPATGCGGGGPEDCEDLIFDVNPGATEGPLGDATCSDGLDNDCDLTVDDLDLDCM